MGKVAVFNQKGGVGKTTTALNLAAGLSRRKITPLLIDTDPQGHLSRICPEISQPSRQSLFDFYQDNKSLGELLLNWEGVGSLIPAEQTLMKVDTVFGKGPSILNKLKLGLEALEKQTTTHETIIDCCPYIGVLSLSAIFATDFVLVPISSDFLSLQSARKVEHTLKALEPVLKKRVNRRYLLTCYDRRRKFTFEVHEEARSLFGEDLLETVISENVAVAKSPQHMKDVFSFSPNSSGARDYSALLDELSGELLLGQPPG